MQNNEAINSDDNDNFAEELKEISNLEAVQKSLAQVEKIVNGDQDNQAQPSEEIEEKEQPEEEAEAETAQNDNEAVEDSEDGEQDGNPRQEKVRKLWKERKKQYRLIAEKAEIQKENDRLKEMLNEALENSKYYYSQSLTLELERAQARRDEAMAAGDKLEYNKADQDINNARFYLNDLKRWESPAPKQDAGREYYPQNENIPQYQTQQYQPQQYQQPNNIGAIEQQIIHDWFEQHPYLMNTSSKYNPEIAQKVQKFAQDYDNKIMRGEVEDSYYSEKYFDHIDNYIDMLKNKTKQVRNIGSAGYVGGVRGVRNATETQKAAPNRIVFNDIDRGIMTATGMSEDEYKKYKLQELKGK